MSKSRDTILAKIRRGAAVSSTLPSMPEDTDRIIKRKLADVTPQSSDELLEQFKRELKALSAEFFLIKEKAEAVPLILKILQEKDYKRITLPDCDDCKEISRQICETDKNISAVAASGLEYPQRKIELAEIPAALVKASFAVSDIGSLVFPYDDNGTTLPHFLPDCIFALAERDKLLANQFEVFEKVSPDKAKNMVFIAGPSRTADIEKVLVLGAHGPRRLVIFMIDN